MPFMCPCPFDRDAFPHNYVNINPGVHLLSALIKGVCLIQVLTALINLKLLRT